MKITDKNISCEIFNGVATVHYMHSFLDHQNINIKSAVFKLYTGDFTGGHKVTVEDGVLDYFTADNESYIYLDITDELIDCVRLNSQLTFKIHNADDLKIDTSKCEVTINYISVNEIIDNESLDLSAGRAGSGKIDLVTGDLFWEQENIVYNGPNRDRVCLNNSMLSLPKSALGSGWKLKAEQYLIQEKNYPFEETSNTYVFVDTAGKHSSFFEKYYYTENSNKVYVPKDMVEFNEDAEYKLKDKDVKVEKEIVTESEYTLSNAINEISKSYLFEDEQEDLVVAKQKKKQLQETIKELESNLRSSKEQLLVSVLSKKTMTEQLAFQSTSITETDEQIIFQKKITELSDKLSIQSRTDVPVIGNAHFTQSQFEEIYSHFITKTAEGNSFKNLTDEQWLKLLQAFVNDSNTIMTLGFDYTGENSGSLYMQKDSNLESEKIYHRVYTKDELINISKESLGKKSYKENIEEVLRNDIFNNFTMSLKDMFTLDLQIEQLENSILKINSNIVDYKEQLEKASMQVSQLELQVPVHYLQDKDGNILGFGKTQEDKIFRLVVIADSNENALYINYDKDGKLMGWIDTEKNETKLEYQSGLLKKITVENKETIFQYQDGLLVGVDHDLKYYYNNNRLSSVTDMGIGVKLEYTHGQVTKVYQITDSSKISSAGKIQQDTLITDNEKLIEYYDYKRTIVTDLKTKKTTTYIWSKDGLKTVYENKINNDGIFGNVNVVTFCNSGNNKSYAIQPVQTLQNLLDGHDFEGQNMEIVSEEYFSEDLYFEDELYLTSYEQTSVETNRIYTLSENLSADNMLVRNVDINKIVMNRKSGITDYILSGFAKADSSWIRRRGRDICGECNEEMDSELLQKVDENRTARRFELRADIRYSNQGTERVESQYMSYDWMQTGWQYCAVPISISEDEDDELIEIKVFFDYSRNTNGAEFYGMRLQEGTWSYTEYVDKQKVYEESSDSEYITRYVYKDNKLAESILTDKSGKEFTTKYEYNSKGAITRTLEHSGLVTENEYNKQGQLIKTYSYHIAEPTCRIYQTEKKVDENGNSKCDLNTFGEESDTYEYNENGQVVVRKDVNGNATVYGYDTEQHLTSITCSVDGEANTNKAEYTCGLQTGLEHNGVRYDYVYDGFGRQIEIDVAGNKYIETKYGENEESTQYCNGEYFKSIKDVDGKVLTLEYGNSEFNKIIIENTYDTFGNIIRTTDKSNEDAVNYDILYDKNGRAINKQYTLNNTSIELETSYNVLGKVQESTERIGDVSRSYGYSYIADPESKIFAIEMPNGTMEHPVYDKLGRLSMTKTLTQDRTIYSKSYNYLQKGDHTSELLASEWYGTNGELRDSLKYGYDEKGNIVSVKENGNLVTSYEYDELSRLKRENNKKSGKTVEYSYDIGGNILCKKEFDYTLLTLEGKDPLQERQYVYSQCGFRDQLMEFDGKRFKYDMLGNPVLYKDKHLEWEKLRQLKKYDDVTFKYNASGLRIAKESNGVVTNYILDGNKILGQDNGNKLYFNYGLEGISGFTYQGVGEYIFKKNRQGDVLGILDENGTEIVRYVYDAWGNHETYVLENGVYINSKEAITELGLNNKAIAEINPFRYRGYYFDAETGLYYLQTRYYDPETGRFINADALEYLDKENINGLNLYAYCGNNPIMNRDDGGTSWWGNFWKGVRNVFNKVGHAIENAITWVNQTVIQPVLNFINVIEPVKNIVFSYNTNLIIGKIFEIKNSKPIFKSMGGNNPDNPLNNFLGVDWSKFNIFQKIAGGIFMGIAALGAVAALGGLIFCAGPVIALGSVAFIFGTAIAGAIFGLISGPWG